MRRTRLYSSALAGVTAATVATATVVVPAQALETSVKTNSCTIELSTEKQTEWQEAISKPTTVQTGNVIPFNVKFTEAKDKKESFLNQLDNLEHQRGAIEAKKNVNAEELTAQEEADYEVIGLILDFKDDYVKALDACAQGKAWSPPQSEGSGSSGNQISIIVGLLGFFGLATVAAIIANAGAGLQGLALPQLPFPRP